MSEKRRGLGRGLGALIPTSADPGRERPVDVFFPSTRDTDGASAATQPGDGGAAGQPGVSGDKGGAFSPDLARVTQTNGSGNGAANGLGAVGNGETHDLTNGNGYVTGTSNGATPVPMDGAGNGVSSHHGTDEADGVSHGATHGVATTPADDEPRTAADGLLPVPGATFAEIPVTSIQPNARQPRTVFDEDQLDELVDSIREVGVLQPVVVRPAGNGYELIMGERRWRATQKAGLDTIPAIIRQTDDSDMLRDALLENLHRAQLNPLEEAAAYQQLLDDFGCTQEELAGRIGRSRPQISNTLRLLKLPPLVQRRLAAGVLSAGHARALLALPDSAAMERIAQRIVAEGLSVRAVEELVALGGDEPKPSRRSAPRAGDRNEALDDLATRLSDRFETRVKVALGKSKGRLTVEFASVQDLNRILGALAPGDPGLFHR